MSLKINDFADFIPAMLVKELRQGLKTRVFSLLFVALQFILTLIILSASLGNDSNASGSIISTIIIVCYGLILLFFQPIRGISAVAAEIQNNTLDFISLTRLSSAQIILGKWLSIACQSILLLISIIPYMTLRYFFGGMNPVLEIGTLLYITLISLGLTAFTVCFSACRLVLVRSIFPIICLIILTWSCMISGALYSHSPMGLSISSSATTTDIVITIASSILAMLYITWYFISQGTSLIAPSAENHARPRRILSLSLFFITSLIILFSDSKNPIPLQIIACCIICIPAIIASLTEDSTLTPRTYQPYQNNGSLKKLRGIWLYPTWPSGTAFAIVLGVLSLLTILYHISLAKFSYSSNEGYCILLSLFGAIFFPALLLSFARKPIKQRFSYYIIIQFFSAIILFLTTIVCEASNTSAICIFFFFHPLAYIPMIEQYPKFMEYETALACLVTLDFLILALLALRAFFAHRSMVKSLCTNCPPPLPPTS